MLPVNKQKLIHVLEFLEKKAEPEYQKALKEEMSREDMLLKAERALELDKQINVLLEQVDKLQSEKNEYTSKLLEAVDKIKGKSIKIGNILMTVYETIQKNPRRVNYQYKKILDKILETYEIEMKFVNRLKNKYKTITPGSTHVSKELEMQRETKTRRESVLKESFIAWIISNIPNLIVFFVNWYRVLAVHSREIAELAEDIYELADHAAKLFESPLLGKGMSKDADKSDKEYIAQKKKQDKKKKNVKESDSFFPPHPEELSIGKEQKVVKHDKQLHEDETEEHEEKSEKEEKKVGDAFPKNVAESKANKIGSKTAHKPIKGNKTLHEEDETEEHEEKSEKKEKEVCKKLSEHITLLQKLTGKKIKLEAMNRPDERRLMGKKPVLDADEHQKEEVDTLKLKNYVNRARTLQKQYGNLEAAADFIDNYDKTTPEILGKVLNISPEEAKKIMTDLNGEPLHERTGDEIKAITGKHKMNEMRPDEIAVTTGKFRRMKDADQHLDEELQDLDEEDYPWNKCMKDQKKEYGSKETAKKVCGSIKAKYGH